MITLGLESRDRDTRETIADFGQMCSVEAGLPGAVHLIARYADDYKQAMVENVMAGGDSSARGMMAGMILGAAHGMAAIPETWISGMTRAEQINALLKQLRRLKIKHQSIVDVHQIGSGGRPEACQGRMPASVSIDRGSSGRLERMIILRCRLCTTRSIFSTPSRISRMPSLAVSVTRDVFTALFQVFQYGLVVSRDTRASSRISFRICTFSTTPSPAVWIVARLSLT
jgi:hypothetical protein